MNKLFSALAFAAIAWPITARSQVIVRVAPPRVFVERRVPPPGPRYVWISGFYRWNGARYIWVPGRYALPPRPGVVWVAPRWVAHNGTWTFVAGYWR